MQLFHRDLDGTGNPPLVVLHGLLGSSRNWQTVGRDLAKKYHVLALDLRNHGQSPHAEPMNYEVMMRDVLAWLDGQGLRRASVLGHSMGGKVAMLLACRHPERVERLIVVDIAPKNYFWPGHRQSFAAMNELNLQDIRSRQEAEIRLEARVPNWGTRKFLTTNLERDAEGRWFWQINLPVLTVALPTLESNPLTADDRYPGPVRVLAGEKSTYIEPADYQTLRNHFPAVEIEVLGNCGHNPHMEARESFVSAVFQAFPATREG